MIKKDNITNYNVENFIFYIKKDEVEKDTLLSELKKFDLNQDVEKTIAQKIQFAYDRLNSSLDIKICILLIFFPLGIVNLFFNSDGFFNVSEQRNLGYVKKVKQYYQFSFIGVSLYILIILFGLLFF
jgi:hypothetical protein